MASQAELVKTFTEESKGIRVPEKPVPMDGQAVEWLAKMMLSEIVELLMTEHPEHYHALAVAERLLREDFEEKHGPTPTPSEDRPAAMSCVAHYIPPPPPEQRIEAQMDALVDCHYYALDAAAKHGMNLDRVFDIVHAANMAKRNPATGLFERRPDGKVLKPPGWQPPDLAAEVQRQLTEGGFRS